MSSFRIIAYCLWSYISFIQAEPFMEDNFLIALDGKDQQVYQIALDGSAVTTIPLSGLLHPVGVDYDPVNKQVFWTDVGKNQKSPTINSASLNGDDQKVIISLTRSSSPEGIAVDPYAGLIFYSDNGPDHIRVVKYDGSQERSIVLNAHNPRSVRLDPVQRYIYWTDWGSGTIERARYDGTDRTKLIIKEGAWINNIALDFQAGVMYWTDAKNDVVEYCDMETGDNIQTLIDGGDQAIVHYYGIAVDEDRVYVTDWTKESLFYTLKNESSLRSFSLNKTFSVVNSIHAYVSDRYPQIDEPSPCTTDPSTCQQLCLPLGSHDNYTCQCNDQTQLADDGINCELIDTDSANGPDVIWLEFDEANTGYVRGINGKPQEFLRYPSLQTWLVRSPLWHWTALDFDSANQRLFLVDKFDKYITQLSLDSNLQLKTIHYGLSGEANGLAYDWLSDSLYWTDALYNWIRVAHAQPYVEHVRTILTGLDHPHGIALNPKAGLMYWVDRGVQDRIMSATLSGENKQVVVSSDAHLNKPTGITLDIVANKMYWCNANQLMSAKLDGSNVKVLFATTASFVDITVQNNYLMAVDEGVGSGSPYLWFFNINSPSRVPKMPLYRRPEAITMYNTDKQTVTVKDMSCDLCAHICISSPLHDNHTQCMCSDGFELGDDNTTCTKLSTAAAPGFIFSLGDRICAVSIEDIQKRTLDLDQLCFFQSADYLFPALDFDYKMAEIYFSETKQTTKTIRRTNLNNRLNNSVVVYGTGEVFGLAVDYVSDNLYWADYTRGQIWVSRVDGTYQTLLVDNRIKPRALVLNIRSRKLYWSEMDTDGHVTIMSCQTDGSMVETFVTENLDNVTGLFLDYTQERLYWSDQGEGEIESISFSGNDRQKEDNLNKLHLNSYDLAIFEDIVGLGDTPLTASGSSDLAGLHMFILSSGEIAADELTYQDVPATYDVLAYNSGNQPAIDGNAARSCAVENGFCDQLCLHITVDTYRCACVDGMVLGADNTSCKPAALKKDHMLLVANDYRHTIHGLDPNDLTSFYSYNLPPTDRPMCVTYDSARGYLYWSEFNDGIIKRMFVDGSEASVLRVGDSDSEVHGLALDPDTENLYYTDHYRNEIGIISPSGTYHKVLIQNSSVLANVHCISLDVTHGYMYFSVMQAPKVGKILRADLDGNNIVEVVSSGLQYPTGLVLDLIGHQIYWADKYTKKLEVASLNGENRRLVHQMADSADPYAVTLVNDTLYWTDWNNPGLFHVNVDGTSEGVALENQLHGLNGIEYVDMDWIAGPTSCSMTSAPPCTHFCIPTPNLPKCLCPDMDQITGDTPDCADQTCPSNLLFATLDPGCGGHTGEECTFTCDQNYVNRTDVHLSCRAGFEWDKDITALCEVGTCPSYIPNGKFSGVCGHTVGETCDFTCTQGYTRTTEEMLDCMETLQWSTDLDSVCHKGMCPVLDLPTNTQTVSPDCQDVAVPGTECTLTCAEGYVQDTGDNKVKCDFDLTWSGNLLTCKLEGMCPVLDLPTNTQTVSPGCQDIAVPGTECTLTCAEGYVQDTGDNKVKCDFDLTWSGNLLTCKLGKCHLLDLPTNTQTVSPDCQDIAVPGIECTLTCAEGYVQDTGDNKVKCNTDLTWSGTLLTCKLAPMTCIYLASPPHTQVVPPACTSSDKVFQQGDKCVYTCDVGYMKSSGSETRTCGNTGDWSGSNLMCVAKETSTVTMETTTMGEGTTAQGNVIGDTGGSTGSEQKKSNKTAVIVGTLFCIALLAGFLIAVVVIMYKRSHKTMAHYRSASNYASGKADDLVPVVGKENFCPSYSSQGESVDLYGPPGVNNNLYTNQPSSHLNMDGSVAFSNPDYEEVEVKVSDEPLPVGEEINCDLMAGPVELPEVQVDVVPPGGQDRTAFTNPLYQNQVLTLGESIEDSHS